MSKAHQTQSTPDAKHTRHKDGTITAEIQVEDHKPGPIGPKAKAIAAKAHAAKAAQSKQESATSVAVSEAVSEAGSSGDAKSGNKAGK